MKRQILSFVEIGWTVGDRNINISFGENSHSTLFIHTDGVSRNLFYENENALQQKINAFPFKFGSLGDFLTFLPFERSKKGMGRKKSPQRRVICKGVIVNVNQ